MEFSNTSVYLNSLDSIRFNFIVIAHVQVYGKSTHKSKKSNSSFVQHIFKDENYENSELKVQKCKKLKTRW